MRLTSAYRRLLLCILVSSCSATAPHEAADSSQQPDASSALPDGPPAQVQDCTYYADPLAGTAANDGSEAAPWGKLETIVADGQLLQAGDILCLRAGNHGSPVFTDQNYSSAITIVAARGEVPSIAQLTFRSSSHVVLDGLLVDGSVNIDPDTDEKERFLVTGDEASHHLIMRNMEVRSETSSATWTKEDWYKLSWSGIDMRGSHIAVEDCQVLNTYHAISLRGDHSRVTRTLVDNFAGDGIRGLGSFSTYENNVVRDAYIDDYAIQHDDAFQAWNLEPDPKIEGVVIRNNQFLQFLDPITPFVAEHQLVSQALQGVIITDGYADGWIVENNLVVVNHFHGISLYGARNCRVQNNTVVQDATHSDTDVPWILLAVQSKTGQTNFDNIVRNNLATMLTFWEFDQSSIVENNADINEMDPSDYRRYFRDYDSNDFHLSTASPGINAGTNQQTSELDLAGEDRISGGIVDTGAYELQQPSM